MSIIDGTQILNYLQPMVKTMKREMQQISQQIRQSKKDQDLLQRRWEKLQVERAILESTIQPIQVAQSMQNVVGKPEIEEDDS